MLVFAGLSRSTFYYYLKGQQHPDKYATLKEEIGHIFEQNKNRYGYRRVHSVLRSTGYEINHKTTLKLMKGLGLRGKQHKHKYKSYKGTVGKIAPNTLNREFKATKPFEKLVTDVTEFAVCDQKVYFSPILDLYNSEIVSYDISRSPNFKQTKEMLNGLFEKLPRRARPLLHSDQGWQYQMKEFQGLLKDNNITQSMSRKGNCLDNSVMENFFGRLKVEMFFGEKFDSVDAFERNLVDYIRYFNNDRISLKLNGMSPIQYRTQSFKK